MNDKILFWTKICALCGVITALIAVTEHEFNLFSSEPSSTTSTQSPTPNIEPLEITPPLGTPNTPDLTIPAPFPDPAGEQEDPPQVSIAGPDPPTVGSGRAEGEGLDSPPLTRPTGLNGKTPESRPIGAEESSSPPQLSPPSDEPVTSDQQTSQETQLAEDRTLEDTENPKATEQEPHESDLADNDLPPTTPYQPMIGDPKSIQDKILEATLNGGTSPNTTELEPPASSVGGHAPVTSVATTNDEPYPSPIEGYQVGESYTVVAPSPRTRNLPEDTNQEQRGLALPKLPNNIRQLLNGKSLTFYVFVDANGNVAIKKTESKGIQDLAVRKATSTVNDGKWVTQKDVETCKNGELIRIIYQW